MRYSRFDIGEYCETCGQRIYYDYWGHVIACARHKQQQEAAKRAVENGRNVMKKLKEHSTNDHYNPLVINYLTA